MFTKILIANRGEIAVRIINECKELGIKTVAICSDPERGALHMRLADEGYCIGAAALKDSYMNIGAIVNAALATKSDVIHPGYGLLSENHEFAKSCERHNISFIGPVSDILAQVSDKTNAKKIAVALRIPVLTGYLAENIDDTLLWAHEIGYPVMIKTSNGGGGAGMKPVYSDDELKAALIVLQTSKNKKLFIEKYIEKARHIEIQVIADNSGNIVTAGSRECSIQMNYKKVLEECPAQNISAELLENLYSDSVKLAKAVNYTGICTVEFIIDEAENYYFMEMNARIQVEHGITEMITGLNLVQWQIRIACGEKIPFGQDGLKLSGHALECRINAHSCGRIAGWRLDNGEARVDHALTDSMTMMPYYDSMIGKLISYGRTRSDAVNKMKTYLHGLHITGIETNIELHKNIMDNENFTDGVYYTSFLNTLGERPVKVNRISDFSNLTENVHSSDRKPLKMSWLRNSIETLFKNKGLYKEA